MADEHPISEADLAAADAVLARLTTEPPPKGAAREKLRRFYAELHARFGHDRFSLRFGLREPRTPLEGLEVSFFRQEIGEQEYRHRVESHVKRPVDLPMLQQFFGDYEAAVHRYGEALTLIVRVATDLRGDDFGDSRDHEVDAAIAKLSAKFDISSDELLTVSSFLTEVQADRETPIQCGDHIGDSVHWIAAMVFSHTAEAWESCKRVASHSSTDPRYLYAATAASLIFKVWIEPGTLPSPSALAAMMRSERAKALAAFNRRTEAVKPKHAGPARTVQPIHFEDFDGHQFERLVFAYHLRTTNWRSLEWYGQTGSDLGRDIWGVTAAGDTLCIQCVNRKTTTAKKLTDDLDSVVQARGGMPNVVRAVCASSVSAALRDKVKEHASNKGIATCEIWSGPEFEERLRDGAESLLKRFIEGVTFPEDPQQLRRFVTTDSGGDGAAIEKVLRVLDRPAFNTPFHRESSLPGFRQAIADTIQALNTGIWQTRDGKEIERIPSRHDLSSGPLRDELALIVDDLTNLRAKFDDLLRLDEIRHCDCGKADCPAFFLSEGAAQEMDGLRETLASRVGNLRRAQS